MFRPANIPDRGLSDEQLMQRICKGERIAFEVLYNRYFDKLVWFARGFIDDVHKAEDAVQEIFIRIIESPEKFDENKKFSTWVYTVTGNACKNILRNEQNRLRLLEENMTRQYPDGTMIYREIDRKLLQERIKTVYDSLNEKGKNIFALRFEQELNIREIAEIMHIPEGSVKSGIYYMLKKFADHLKDFTYEK